MEDSFEGKKHIGEEIISQFQKQEETADKAPNPNGKTLAVNRI